MNDDQPGAPYPAAPPPRPEPYSSDEDDAQPQHAAPDAPAPAAGESPSESSSAPSQTSPPAAWWDPSSQGRQGDTGWAPHAPDTGPHAPDTGPHAAPYPPAQPPAEHVAAEAAAASVADTRYSWQSPAALPWQQADRPPAPAATRPPERRRRTLGAGVVVLLVLVALLGGIVLGALGARALWPAPSSAGLPPSGTSPTSTERSPESVAGIASAALESTVYIEVVGGNVGSSGSGMVLREDGYVVTNNHVIAPAADGDGRVTLTFADGSKEDADIVGRTVDYDLAVLHVERAGLTPLPLADSDAVVVGDTAIAVGAPLGLEGTVTSGIISALNRPVEAGQGGEATSFINAIQTDAAINPGNSGGPLLNGAGEVIGINTAIAQAGGRQAGSIGLGFAIPANQVRRTAEEIIETGQATYPVIGVALDTRYTGEGVLVLEEDAGDNPAVTPGGPGEAAGIEPGDVITHFDGQPVTQPSELIVAVRSRAPGDVVVLTVRDGSGAPREVEVTLGEMVSD